MNKTFTDNQTFQGVDFTTQTLNKGDYENCTFVNCAFSNLDLSGINFIECIFKNCDLSMAQTVKTVFRDVKFFECKLLGLRFEGRNDFLFSVDFEACQLNLSSFFKRTLKKARFQDCILREVDFTEADLTNSTFDNCDLSGAIFADSILEKVDFRTSYNYSINPERNRIKKAKFSIPGVLGLLDKYEIEIE